MTRLKTLCAGLALAVLLSGLMMAQDLESSAEKLVVQIAERLPDAGKVTLDLEEPSLQEGGFVSDIRAVIERELQTRGIQVAKNATDAIGLKILVSRGLRGSFLLAQIGAFDDGNVIIQPVAKPLSTSDQAGPWVSLKMTRIWAQEAPILDFLVVSGQLWVLSPGSVSLMDLQGPDSRPAEDWKLDYPGPAVRDPRGRLQVADGDLHIYLNQAECQGSGHSGTALKCRRLQSDWPLVQNGDVVARAHPRPGRNSFDLFRLSVPAQSLTSDFFAACYLPESGSWLLAGTDGEARLVDQTGKLTGSFPGWAGDIASVQSSGCQTVVVAVIPSENQSDSLRAFTIAQSKPEPAGDEVALFGQVTALWSQDPTRASLVIKDRETGKYVAYELEATCPR